MNEGLAAELARMAAEDQRIRPPPKGRMVRRRDRKTAMEHRRIDGENTERLGRILAEHGWPGRSLVGDQGSHDAWLIAQHADHDPAFQREALDLLTDVVARDEARPRELAYLTGRVRVNEGAHAGLWHADEARRERDARPAANRGPRAPRRATRRGWTRVL